MASTHFTGAELERIKAAVAEAENHSSGEIVPYYVDRSDDYDEAVWRGGVLFGAVALLTFYCIRTFSSIWMPLDLTQVLFAILLAVALGNGLTYWIPPLRRWLAGRRLLDRRVAARALEAFVAEEVFNTRDRSGILIFLSLFEHRVHVIGDSGINARVKPADWEDIVEIIVSGIKSGNAADGLVHAIEKCGALLKHKEVVLRADDRNELSDNLRIGK
jgi:putative membrane protein